VFLEISTACNRSCHYCPVAEFPSKQEFVSEDVIAMFLQSISGFTGILGFHSYNEPLLHPNIDLICYYMRRYAPRSKIICYTNGDKLTNKLRLNLTEAGLDHFLVTRHPPYSKKWDDNISALQREFPEHIRLHKITSWMDRAKSVKTAYSAMSGATSCRYPEGDVFVKCNGDVMLCCNDFHNEAPRGNILNQTIDEIYWSEETRQLRENIRHGKFDLAVCKRCVA
jgi:radical SAM protein with 4Fe4S-binding SPASM domain